MDTSPCDGHLIGPGRGFDVRRALEPSALMRRVAEQALAVVPAADGAAVEIPQGPDLLLYATAAGILEPHAGTLVGRRGSLSGAALDSAATLWSNDVEHDDRVDRETALRLGLRSFVVVPLRRHHEIVGVLKVAATRPGAFTSGDIVMLGALADFVAAAIVAAADLSEVTEAMIAGVDRAAVSLPIGRRAAGPVVLGEAVEGEADALVSWDDDDRPEVSPLADFVARVLDPELAATSARRGRIQRVLAPGGFSIVAQPVVDLASNEIVGAEALARFAGPPVRGPDLWFAEAADVGLGVALETAAAEAAIALLPELPPDVGLAVNAGPPVIVDERFLELVAAAPPGRLAIELTEHVPVDDYPAILAALAELRRAGVVLAIDDTGAGFAGLAHILRLRPEIIKLDQSLTTGIDTDPVRRALAAALLAVASEIGGRVIAEGIETEAELDTVVGLGIHLGQGYLLGRPQPVDALARSVAARS